MSSDAFPTFVEFVQHFINSIQKLHWSTNSRTTHELLGQLYADLPPLLDNFVEVYLATVENSSVSQNIIFTKPLLLTDSNIVQQLKGFDLQLANLNTSLSLLDPSLSHIANIRDEMRALIRKYVGLLSRI